MLLVTTWFGTFLVDEGTPVHQRFFPKNATDLADRLADVEDWKVLDEERELLALAEEVFVTEPRLERVGGRFSSEKPPFLDPAAFGYDRALLHEAMVELAKRRMRKAIRPEDHLRQAVAAVDDLLEQENTAIERVREWYGLHFPELARMVDDRTYLDLIATHGRRERMPLDTRDSVGAELGEAEERELRELSSLAKAIADRRKALETYVDHRVRALAPNVSELTGPMIAARLVTLAGGVEDLARLPSGTVQLLGAEKALFRHLKSGTDPPKHGVLFQHPLVHRAPPWQRGAITRAFAGKIAMAARADAFTHRSIADELRKALEETLTDIRRRKEKRPERARAVHRARPKRARGRKRF